MANASRFFRTVRLPAPAARKPFGRLGVTRLDDRIAPSASLPLNGTSWTEIGPKPIAVQAAGENTTSPGNLPSTGRISGVALHPTDANIAYVASAGGGVWKTTDGSVTWAQLTDRLPASTPGLQEQYRTLSMGSVALSPINPNRVYAGEGEQNFSGDSYPGNGLLVSADAGANWRLVTGTAPGGTEFVNSTIAKVVVLPNPAAPTDATQELVYIMVSSSANPTNNGVYLSRDGALTFAKINENMYRSTVVGGNAVRRDVALTDFNVDPTNPGVVYIACAIVGTNFAFTAYNLAGIYKTSDALSADPLASTFYTVVFGGNGSFIPGSLLGRIEFVLAPTRPSVLYAMVGNGTGDDLLGAYRTSNAGTDWQPFGTIPNVLPAQAFYNLAISVDPRDEGRLAISGTLAPGTTKQQIVFTADALRTDATNTANSVVWSQIGLDAQGEGPHVDQHTSAFSPVTGQLGAGSDGGLFRTTSFVAGAGGQFTVDWVSANGDPALGKSLAVFQATGVALHPSDYNQALMGGQDNGIVRFFDPGTPLTPNPIDAQAWPEVNGGDGGRAVYDFVNPLNAYHIAPVESYGTANFVQKSTDGGLTWRAAATGINATNGPPGNTLFYPPLEIDPSQSQRLFVGTDNVYETTNGAGSWHTLGGKNLPFVTGLNFAGNPEPPFDPVVSAVGIGRFDPNIIYVAVTNRAYTPPGATTLQPYFTAIYRIDLALSMITNYPAYYDVSPFGAGPTGQASVTRGNPLLGAVSINGSLRRLPGLTMPPFPGAPVAPAPNDFFGNITKIAVDPFDSDIVVIVTETHDIFRTENGGASWRRMNTAGLPNGATQQSFQVVAIDPNILPVGGQADDFYYIGTNIGVYRLLNPTVPYANQSWVRVGGESQPDARVDDLVINTSTGILLSGTHGRGAWEFQIRPYVAGVVFTDTNGNGVRDASESLAPGKGVLAFTQAVPPVEAASTRTDPNGSYRFVSLPNGDYQIVSPPSSTVTIAADGSLFQSTPDRLVTVDQNTTLNNVDIGSFIRSSISGTVFDDLTANRLFDGGDGKLAGWLVQLTNSLTGAVLATVTTAADGSYSFTGLGPLQDRSTFSPTTGYPVIPYRVVVPSKAGYVQTTPVAADVTLASGVPVAGVDVGEFALVTLAGSVFDDTNGDGRRQGELPLGGVTVRLVSAGPDGRIDTAADVVLDTRASDPNGAYAFTSRGPGTYYLEEALATLQAGYRPTSGARSADGLYAILGPITPTSGQAGLTFDFGNFRDAGLSGFVFEDDNGDGQRQLPQEGRPVIGATVILLDGSRNPVLVNGNPVTTTTAADGSYRFDGLQPQGAGNTLAYFARVIAPADLFVQTSADARTILTSGIVTGGLNLGYFRRTFISGFAFEDENGNGIQDAGERVAAGFPVSLLNSTNPAAPPVGTAVTDVTGLYRFAYDPANPAGFSGGPLQLGGPGGAVLAYRVVANVNGVIQTNAPGDLVLTSGVPAAGPTLALFRTVGFTGTVFDDVNGDGVRQGGEGPLAGVTVELVTVGGAVAVNPANGVPITTVTDANGFYNLQAPNGTFTVRLSNLPAGTITTTAFPAPILTRSGVPQPAIDIGTFRTFTVAGRVFTDTNGDGQQQSGEQGLGSLTVRLVLPGPDGRFDTADDVATPYSAITSPAGDYAIPGVGPGTFGLVPVRPAGFYYTQPTGPVTVAGQSKLNFPQTRFGLFLGATIRGSVFEDLNRSGVRDGSPLEPGSVGWTVQPLNAAGAVVPGSTPAVTDAAGNYTLTAVPPGTTAVRLTDRAGWLATKGTVTLAGPPTSGGTLNAPPLGGLRLGSVAGRVFNDANRNGLLDNSESGLGGVVVELVQGTATVARQTAGADGGYQFLGLTGGGYTVRVAAASVPAGRVQTGPQTLDGPVYTPTVTEGNGTAGNKQEGQNFGVAGRKRYAVSADGGGGPRVRVYDAALASDGQSALVSDQFVYEEGFTGGVRVASADVTGDGVDDLITVAGKGGGPRVRVIDGATGKVVYDYFAYEPSFRDGLFVAAADVDGDGFADIITGTDSGGGPRVTVFSGKDGRVFLDFFAFDERFRGGVRVGAGDIDGDGRAEIIAGSGPGLGAEVRAFNAAGGRVSTFAPVDPGFTAGVYVAGGATDPFTRRASILVGTGAGFADQGYAFVFDGSGQQLFQLEALPPATVDSPVYTGDVRVASFDVTGDGVPEIVIASGAGARSQVRFLDGNNRREIGNVFPFEAAFLGGLFVG